MPAPGMLNETLLIGFLTFIGGIVTAGLGFMAARRTAMQQKAQAEKAIEVENRKLDIEAGDRWKEYAESTEVRLEKLESKVQSLQEQVNQAIEARSKAEKQRDAAIDHARDLREAWPEASVPLAPPQIIQHFFQSPPK